MGRLVKIGFSFWGFCENIKKSRIANTPDGLRYCRPLIVDEMIGRGHNVYALQQQRELEPYAGLIYSEGSLPELDVLFVEWRWPTYKNSGSKKFEPDLDRQSEILDHYHGNIPVIIWDTDLKLSPIDERRWPKAIIADPSIDPVHLTRPRHRLNYCTDFNPLYDLRGTKLEYGYVGNNYERQHMFKKYISAPALQLRQSGIQTKVFGNWLQASPERPHPSLLIKDNPYVAFCDRVGFTESMSIQNLFLCTTHITKDMYAKRGFVPPRYLESLMCRTIGLVPEEFKHNSILGSSWCVRTSDDIISVVKKISKMSFLEMQEVLDEQEFNIKNCGYDFTVKNVVNFIEDKIS